MDDGGRRCALSGCHRTIPTTDGRPERRYCTAAHRVAARQARRAARQADQRSSPERLAETLPWLREPADASDAPRPVDAVGPGPAVHTPRDRRAPRPGGRALAMLGVAGILAGGYVATDTQPEPSPPPVRAAPEGDTADAWARRASVALTAVNEELDVLDQAEEEWRRLPEARRAVVPAPVVALEERRSVLQQRRATLQSQLDAYRSLREAQQELAVSEQHLRTVEKALDAAPPQRRRSAEQEAAIAALDEQRDLRLRRRDAQRAELESLQAGVAIASRMPLPADAEATAQVSRDVHEVVRNGGTVPNRSADPTPPRPDVIAGREEEDGKPRQEVGTSGPPDPRGPRDESEERRAAHEKQSASEPEDAERGEPEASAGPADPTPGPKPDGDSAASSADGPPAEDERPADTTRDTFAELRERAVEVAREARKAEAARKAALRGQTAGDDEGTSRSAEPARRTETNRAPRKPSPTPRPRPSDVAVDDQRPDGPSGRAGSAAASTGRETSQTDEKRDATWRPSPRKRDASARPDDEWHERRGADEKDGDERAAGSRVASRKSTDRADREAVGDEAEEEKAAEKKSGSRKSGARGDSADSHDEDSHDEDSHDEDSDDEDSDDRPGSEHKRDDSDKTDDDSSDDRDADHEGDASVGRAAATSPADRS